MQCAKHATFRSRKALRSAESYRRDADWWKWSEDEPQLAWKSSAHSPKAGSYKAYTLLRKAKVWSIVDLNTDPQDLTEPEFNKLAEAWRADTRFHSSLSKKFTHSAYVTIMAAGRPAVPLILRDLQ